MGHRSNTLSNAAASPGYIGQLRRNLVPLTSSSGNKCSQACQSRSGTQCRTAQRALRCGVLGWISIPLQGLLRMDCVASSRTDYYTQSIALFVLPIAIVLYVAAIRLILWSLRPAILSVMPHLAGHAFFDHAVHGRTSALCFDVRRTLCAGGAIRPVASAPSTVEFNQRVCCRSRSGSLR